MSKFICSTIGMFMGHERLKRPTIIKANYYRNDDNSVTIKAVSGNNLSVIKSIKFVTINAEEFSNRDYDPYNDIVEFDWAMSLLGCY